MSTDAFTLRDTKGIDLGIWRDLGDGAAPGESGTYGTFNWPRAYTHSLTLPLRGGIIGDVADAAGGYFSIGGKGAAPYPMV